MRPLTLTITAMYGGDSAFDGSTSDALTQSVDNATTAMALSSDVNPSVTGQTVTFTATVTPSTPSAATGTVDFADGSTPLGSTSLDGSGQAKLATSALAAGTHSISATYGGDPNFNGATSNVLTQTVNAAPAGTFSLSPSPSSVTASQSSTATFTITVTPAGGFTGNVTLSAGGVPPQSSASRAQSGGGFVDVDADDHDRQEHAEEGLHRDHHRQRRRSERDEDVTISVR